MNQMSIREFIDRLNEIQHENIMYHITREDYIDDILTHGLEPMNDAQHDWYNKENRVYLLRDTNVIGEVRMWLEAKDNTDIPFTLLQIDTSNLPLKHDGSWYYSTLTISPNPITDLGAVTLAKY